MITHVVAFRWRDELPAGHVERVAEALATLPAAVASLRSYRFGADVGAAAGNHDFAIVATVDDLDGWREYDSHPAHERIRSELLRPFVAERAAVQFES